MGSMSYRMEQGRMMALGSIVNEGYNHIVVLTGLDEQNKERRGAYQIFKDPTEKELREFAESAAKEAGRKLSKIELYSLECRLSKEIKI